MRVDAVARTVAGLAILATAALAGAEGQRGIESIKKAVETAKIVIPQAIETAQKEVAGGKVVEAGLEIEEDGAFYEVVVLVKDDQLALESHENSRK
jgi:uncharacterized membrane protein YkoI